MQNLDGNSSPILISQATQRFKTNADHRVDSLLYSMVPLYFGVQRLTQSVLHTLTSVKHTQTYLVEQLKYMQLETPLSNFYTGLSYTADEMGIPFPKPFTMQVDNKAAIAFSDNSAFKSKLKHIDVRQEWVQTLRNKSIVTTKYVRSEDNLADLFTKISTADIFERLRNRMMFKRSSI